MERRDFLTAFGAASALLTLGAAAAAADEAPAGGARVVIAGGDLTEIAFALGAGDRIVGVDQTSTYPPETAARAQIGYVRRLSAEGVLSLAPSLLLAAHDAGPPATLAQLRAAGLAIAVAPAGDAPDAATEKFRFVGAALGLTAEAAALTARYEAALAEARAKVARLKERPKVLFLLSIRDGAPIVAGAGTSAETMIRAAGGTNAAAGFEGYKPMSQEAILAAEPEIILMMSQHAERSGGAQSVLARPEFALTPAGRAGRLVTMDGMLMLGFGPRTPEAMATLARKLQPDAAAAAGL